ncbi:MAG: LarC family nickel insertion protein [Deferrisomatales bacterium]|nr:LarC family nickel insertion protein [Deferrisomatales bacterium]
MRRILYFDASAGVSGDMFVGALLDLGASLETVKRHVASLGVEGLELRARKVERRGLVGTKFDVLAPGTGRPVDEPADGGHGHEHGQGHGHGHGAHHHRHPHRGLPEICSLIRAAGLPGPVAAAAVAVFELLGAAEGKVHGVSPEAVHFHEVGALDSIADIVAASSAFHQLGAEDARCSPIHVGCGTVRCAHGVLPVPAPATLELLCGVPAYSDGVRGELTTPTGAALLRHFCAGFGPMPPLVVQAVGYGAGSKDFGVPGLFRATLGIAVESVAPSQAANLG